MIDPDMQRQIEKLAEQAHQFATRMQNLDAEGSDDANLVRAVCAPGGKLVDLHFSAEARYQQMDDLREAILTAVHRASDAASADLHAMVSEMSQSAGGFGTEGMADVRRQVAEYERLVRAQREKLDDLRGGLRS